MKKKLYFFIVHFLFLFLIIIFQIADWRYTNYLPSELATATMMHVVKSVEPRLEAEYQSQLFGILGIYKVHVLKYFAFLDLDVCYTIITYMVKSNMSCMYTGEGE